MTAYSPRLQLEQVQVLSYTPHIVYPYESNFHEDNHEEQQQTVEHHTHDTSTSPAPDVYYDNNANCRLSDEQESGYGLHYHYGKLWPTYGLGGHESPWTTASSSNWTPPTQDPASLSLPDPTPMQIPHFVSSPPNPTNYTLVGQVPNHGGLYGTPRTSVDVQPPFPNSPNLLPYPAEIVASRSSPPLSGIPRSPRFLRSLKVDPTLEAHQRVPPEKISTYSELSPNIEFMERLKLEESYHNLFRPRSPTPAVVPAATQPPINTTPTQRSLPDATQAVSTGKEKGTSSQSATSRSGSGGKIRLIASASTSTSTSQTSTAAALPKKRKRRKAAVDESQAPGSNSAMSEESCRAEARKAGMACTFCRERKISCGRPPPGSPDDTCNQCARRSFKCVFLPEPSSKSRRRS